MHGVTSNGSLIRSSIWTNSYRSSNKLLFNHRTDITHCIITNIEYSHDAKTLTLICSLLYRSFKLLCDIFAKRTFSLLTLYKDGVLVVFSKLWKGFCIKTDPSGEWWNSSPMIQVSRSIKQNKTWRKYSWGNCFLTLKTILKKL